MLKNALILPDNCEVSYYTRDLFIKILNAQSFVEIYREIPICQ